MKEPLRIRWDSVRHGLITTVITDIRFAMQYVIELMH
jgi:hypothetical protein